ncbi:AI-2E family transporter [Streptococcus loxodontisalivarius]|uniref:PurR-regulated permease PerM n=1 Tax=Streptococcus loxodontisalivarius TaxID=1349415 RepID=A0ABS2PS89_9STRE|nr:AI-2E family transporter [Streptococcus loxodontisalivarius]MBM7642791.1 putative PurR-regulated permease PerM [Streptococcus loxodontisalivarius]
MKFDKRQVYSIVIAFSLCYLVMSLWSTGAGYLTTFWSACQPFLIGAAIAYIINIVMSSYEALFDWMGKQLPFLLKIKGAASLILAYVTFVAVIVWVFSIVLPDLIASISSLSHIDTSVVTKWINELSNNETVSKVLNYFGMSSDIASTLSSYSQQILSQVVSVLTNLLTSVTSIASTLLNVVISLIFSIYVLGNKKTLVRQAGLLIDTYTGRFAKTIHYVVGIMHKRFHGFFVGQTLEAIILGTLTAIGMTIFHFPYAATVGVLVAFTALIPVVGAYIGTTVGFILVATQSITTACWFVVFMVVLQQFEGNLIYPRVVGGSIGLPGMWVLLAITVGGALYGILGMLVAVPLSATIYQIIKDNIKKRQQLSIEE